MMQINSDEDHQVRQTSQNPGTCLWLHVVVYQHLNAAFPNLNFTISCTWFADTEFLFRFAHAK
jgi:hypothetical protein